MATQSTWGFWGTWVWGDNVGSCHFCPVENSALGIKVVVKYSIGVLDKLPDC